MNDTMKIVIAVVGVFAAGFIMVGSNKQQSKEQMEAASMIRNYVAIQEMANHKCPAAIQDATGDQVFFPSKTESDKDSYITLMWEGDENVHFKKASCTLKSSLGGISDLIIDDKVIIKK